MSDDKKPEKKKKNHFAKHWGKYTFGALAIVLAAEHILKMETPNPLHESHPGFARQEPDAPQRHHYDPNTRPENMPSETHYIKGDRTSIHSAADFNSSVQFTLNQGDCVAVTGRPTDAFYAVSVWGQNNQVTTGYVDAWEVRKLRPNQGCNPR